MTLPMTFTSLSGADLPGKSRFGGYLYVIEFSNGTIKVGRSGNPRARLTAHQATAQTFGASLTCGWLSSHHDEYQANEKNLILRVSASATGQSGAEYFTGIPFQDAVSLASSLPFTPVDIAAREEEAKQSAKRIGERLNAFGPRHPWDETARKAIAQLLGRRPDGSYDNPSNWGDREMPVDLSARLHDLGLDEEFANADYVDVMENTLARVLEVEALKLRIYLLRAGRFDLASPRADEV